MGTSQEKPYKYEGCWYAPICTMDCNHHLCIKYNEMSYMMETSNLPKSKQQVIRLKVPNADRDAYNRLAEIKADIYDFVQEGRNLYIASEQSGNGKTSWAIKLMHKYFEEMWDGNGLRERALFIHVPTFIMKCKEFKRYDADFERLKKLALTVDLVVWDDIASTEISPFDYAQLLVYIDNRLLSDLSNIYTGNFPDKEKLADRLGNKLASRVFSSNTEVIIFKGGDVR